MIPGFPLAAPGIRYNLRCEAVTACRIGTFGFQTFVKTTPGGSPSKDIDNGPEFRGQVKDEGLRRWKFWPMRAWRPVPAGAHRLVAADRLAATASEDRVAVGYGRPAAPGYFWRGLQPGAGRQHSAKNWCMSKR